jgi:DNA-binding transcriptional regulator YiaG
MFARFQRYSLKHPKSTNIVDTVTPLRYFYEMITPQQSRAARGLVDWSQQRLADAAGTGLSTVRDFEKGRRVPKHDNLAALRAALEAAGVEFIAENGGGAGVRLRKLENDNP